MKNLQLLLILGLSFLIASCGDDDPLSETIVDGSWNLVSIEQTSCDDATDNIALTLVENNCITFGGDDELCNNVFSFSANGEARLSFTEDGEADFDEFTYTVNDDTNQITLCEDVSDCNTFTVNEDQFTWTIEDSGNCMIIAIFEKA